MQTIYMHHLWTINKNIMDYIGKYYRKISKEFGIPTEVLNMIGMCTPRLVAESWY